MKQEAGCGRRRSGGGDAMRAGYSKKSAKTLGVLGKGGYCIRTVKAANSATFIEFPKGLQRACPKFAFILDNAIRHKSETATEFADSAKGDMRLIFPPQYEPRLDHIRTQWGAQARPPWQVLCHSGEAGRGP